MNYTLKKTLQKLGPSPCDLNSKTVKSIKSKFPVPFEHKILWADVNFHNSASPYFIFTKEIFSIPSPVRLETVSAIARRTCGSSAP